MMDLFSFGAEAEREQNAPLAYRMRPQTLDEVVGQADVVGPALCCGGWSIAIG